MTKEERKEYNKAYRLANFDKIKEQTKAYYMSNRDKVSRGMKAYHLANKEKIKEYQKAYHQKHIGKSKERSKNYYHANKENFKNYRLSHADKIKAYRLANAPKIKEWHKAYRLANKAKKNKYFQDRCKSDPAFKLLHCLRFRLYIAIKSQKTSKSNSTINLIGCTIEFLKQHLENQFTEGMSWDNQGDWHVDHILPCSSFDLLDPEQQKICFHYTNLQPLWAEDNLKKSDNIVYV